MLGWLGEGDAPCAASEGEEEWYVRVAENIVRDVDAYATDTGRAGLSCYAAYDSTARANTPTTQSRLAALPPHFSCPPAPSTSASQITTSSITSCNATRMLPRAKPLLRITRRRINEHRRRRRTWQALSTLCDAFHARPSVLYYDSILSLRWLACTGVRVRVRGCTSHHAQRDLEFEFCRVTRVHRCTGFARSGCGVRGRRGCSSDECFLRMRVLTHIVERTRIIIVQTHPAPLINPHG